MKQLEIIQSNLQACNDAASAATPQEALNLMESFEGWGRCRNLIDSKSEESKLFLSSCSDQSLLHTAQEATLTSFFTPYPVADTIMSVLKILYYSFSGNELPEILDPSAGAGAFSLAAMKHFPESPILAYEKDELTRRILTTNMSSCPRFDCLSNYGEHFRPYNIIASNIPFGNIPVTDGQHIRISKDFYINKLASKSIHSYYFAQSSWILITHGILAFITSRSFIESPTWKPLRQALIDFGMRVMSMTRLPDNLFPTVDVGTDLIVLTSSAPEDNIPVSAIDDLFIHGVPSTYGSEHIHLCFPLVGHEPHNGKLTKDQYGKPSYKYHNKEINILPDLIYQIFSSASYSGYSKRSDIFDTSKFQPDILHLYKSARFSMPFISSENKCRHDKIIRNNSKKYQDNYAKSSQTTTQAKN